MYFEENWQSMAEKEPLLGVLTIFKQALVREQLYFITVTDFICNKIFLGGTQNGFYPC